jgi:hypothetical protein
MEWFGKRVEYLFSALAALTNTVRCQALID